MSRVAGDGARTLFPAVGNRRVTLRWMHGKWVVGEDIVVSVAGAPISAAGVPVPT